MPTRSKAFSLNRLKNKLERIPIRVAISVMRYEKVLNWVYIYKYKVDKELSAVANVLVKILRKYLVQSCLISIYDVWPQNFKRLAQS